MGTATLGLRGARTLDHSVFKVVADSTCRPVIFLNGIVEVSKSGRVDSGHVKPMGESAFDNVHGES
jgi:hypothetical protein